MATYDCEVAQAVATLGEDIGALPAPSQNSMPDIYKAEGIGSDAGGGGAEIIRDIPPLVRDVP